MVTSTASLPARTLQFSIVISLILLISSGCVPNSPGSSGPGRQASSTIPAQQPDSSSQTIPATSPDANRFGVFISRHETASPEVVNAVKESGAAWGVDQFRFGSK